MRTPTRFRAETKYGESAEKKANVNLPVMARVGNGATVAAVVGRTGWYHIRLVDDDNRLTQCKAEGVGLVDDDWIYVIKARDRKLTYYKFHSFIQSTGGLPSPLLYARGIIIPDNVAQAFYIEDDDGVGAGSPEYLRIVSTDGSQAMEFNFNDDDVDFIVNANAIPDALQILGSDGIIRSGAGILLVGGVIDVNGIADGIVLDTDGDTTISAPADDQIDFEISGADDFTMTANAFNVLAGSGIVMADGTTIGQVAGPLLTFDDTLNYLEITGCDVGVGTATPDRLFHAEESDAVTNAITYAQRLSHVSTNTPVALFGVGLEMELEDGGDVMQVASELVTLWADPTSGAESPLFRGTTYPIAVAGPGYWGFWTWTAIDAAGVTVIPNGAGDVPSGLTAVYRLSESGGGVTGGLVTVSNNNSVVLYNDGVDACTLTVAAAGNVTIARSAGAATFDISILLVWL